MRKVTKENPTRTNVLGVSCKSVTSLHQALWSALGICEERLEVEKHWTKRNHMNSKIIEFTEVSMILRAYLEKEFPLEETTYLKTKPVDNVDVIGVNGKSYAISPPSDAK